MEGGYGAGSFAALNQQLERSALYFGAATGAARGLVSTLSAFREFDRQLTLTNSVADGTARTFNQLKDAAVQFSLNSTQSSTQAAQAMYYLASAGYSVKEAITAMNGVMLLQQATMGDLSRTSDLIVSSLNQYGLEAKDATVASDIFAASISKSQATLEKLSYAMRQVGPVAAYVGQSLRETTSWLSVLFQSGLRGEQAGTALRNIMLRLIEPTQHASSIMRTLGVEVIDPLSLKFRGLQSVMEDFASHQTSLSAGVIKMLVGDEASAGFKIILKSVTENKEALDKAKEALNTAAAGGNKDAITAAQENVDKLTSSYKKMYAAVNPDNHDAVRIAIQNMGSFDSQIKIAQNDVTQFGMALGEVGLRGVMTLLTPLAALGKGFTDLSETSKNSIAAMTYEGVGLFLLISRYEKFKGVLESIMRLGFPKELEQSANALTRVAGAASTATNAGGTLLAGAPGVRVPLGSATAAAEAEASALTKRIESIVTGLTTTTAVNSRAAMLAGGSAGFDFNSRFMPATPFYPPLGNRPGVDFARTGVPGPWMQGLVNEYGASRYAAAAAPAAGEAAGAGAASRISVGGVANALLLATIGADIGKMIYDGVKAYVERNTISGPTSNVQNYDQMLDMVRRTALSGDNPAALSNALGTVKAVGQEKEVLTQDVEKFKKYLADPLNTPDADNVRKQLIARGIKDKATQDKYLMQILRTGTVEETPGEFSVIGGGEGGGASVYQPGQVPDALKGMNFGKAQGEMDVAGRLRDTQARLEAITDTERKAQIVARETAARMNISPEQLDRQLEKDKASQEETKLLRDPQLFREIRQMLEQRNVQNMMSSMFIPGTDPERVFGLRREVALSQFTNEIDKSLEETVKKVQASFTGLQIPGIDLQTLLGRGGGRAGAAGDVSVALKEAASRGASIQELKEVFAAVMEKNFTAVYGANPALNEDFKKFLDDLKGVLLHGMAASGGQNSADVPIGTPASDKTAAAPGGRFAGAASFRGGDFRTDEKEFQEHLAAAIAKANAATNLGIRAGAMERSLETQRTLYSRSDGSGRGVAKPGGSMHGPGLANDLKRADGSAITEADWAAIAPYMEAEGIIRGDSVPGRHMAREAWHVEPRGAYEAVQAAGGAASVLRARAGTTRSADAPGLIESADTARLNMETSARKQLEMDKKAQEKQIAELQRDAELAKLNATKREAEESLRRNEPGANAKLAEATSALARGTVKWENEIQRITLQYNAVSQVPAVRAAAQAAGAVTSAERLREAEALARRENAQVPLKEFERDQTQRLQAAQTAQTFAGTQITTNTLALDSAGLSRALASQTNAELQVKYTKELGEAQKELIELEARRKPSTADTERIEQLKKLVDALKEAKAAEESRANSIESAARRSHDAAVKTNEEFKNQNQYTGSALDGIKYASEKARLEQDTMFDIGAKSYQMFSDRLGTIFTQAISGRTAQAKQTFGQFLGDLAGYIEKAMFQKLILNPLMDSILGTGGSNNGTDRQGNSSSTPSSRGGGSGGGLFGFLGNMFSSSATNGLGGGLFKEAGGALNRLFGSGPELTGNGTFFGDLAGAESAGFVIPNAKGNLIMGNRIKTFGYGGVMNYYASGGAGAVVTAPTMVAGGTGIAGEAGPEAILPLRRGRSGNLGVEMHGGATGHMINYNPAITINMDGGGDGRGGGKPDQRSAQAFTDQLHIATQAAVIDVVRNQQRPGGMLYNQENNLKG